MECGCMILYFLPGPIMLLISWVLHIASFSTSHWSSDDVSNAGLWEICRGLSPADTNRDCFKFSQRDHLPLMPFICSALSTVSLILLTATTIWSLASIFQNHSRASRWQRKSGMLSLLSVVLHIFCICLYGASYNRIPYNMIPKWSEKFNMELSWSFTVGCVAAAVSLTGATLCISLALKVKEISNIPPPMSSTAHIPSLHIHPPPSSRVSTPSRFPIHPRVTSPLPFGRGRFAAVKNSRRMTPVHMA